jgi:hypothetical protein
MKTTSKVTAFGVASAVTVAAMSSTSLASGHFIAGLQGQFPAYDLNDTWVFQSSRDGYTTIISSANPSAPGQPGPISGVTFGDEGLYNLHISQDGEFSAGLTLTFDFDGDSVSVGKIGAPNADVGEAGDALGSGAVGETVELDGGIFVWTGRGQDPFFGNGIDLAEFSANRAAGKFTPEVFEKSGDLFTGATASFIVADIPNEMLGAEIKVFTTTSVPYQDGWAQVSRHANVLFPYIFFADTPTVQEDHEQHRPDEDVAMRRKALVNNAFWAVSVSGGQDGNEMTYANQVADAVMPDVLTYKPGTEAGYNPGSLNGRGLSDDAMNTVLGMFAGTLVDDHADDPKRYSAEFPYIVSAE